MTGAGNSCRRWGDIKLKYEDKPCKPNCFEPQNGQCADYKLLEVVKRDPNDVKPFLETNSPVRRLIDITAECSKCSNPLKEKSCKFSELQETLIQKCRPLRTLMNYKPLRQPTPYKPDVNYNFLMSDGTAVGRVFPSKFSLRRMKARCKGCGKDAHLRETLTDLSNVVLLSDCCHVEVYPQKKLDNWHHVTVGKLTDKRTFTKKVISETCVLEPKRPPKLEIIVDRRIVIAPKKKKRRKKKKKNKKNKKGKGKGKKSKKLK